MHPHVNGVNECFSRQNGTNGSSRHRVYVLSAKDSIACLNMMKNLAINLRQSIQEGQEPSPGDLAYTLLERRSRLPWVVAIRSVSLEELAGRLEKLMIRPLNATKEPRLGFVFNGQGAQWYAMGRELIAAYPVFSTSIQKAGQILEDYGAVWSLHGMRSLIQWPSGETDADPVQTS